MADLIREFPCFSGFVILALLVLVFCAIMVAENIALARIKVRALVDLQKAKGGSPHGEVPPADPPP